MKLSTLEANNANQQSEIEVLQEEMTELSTDMKLCKEKEAKLLEYTEKLTETNVSLQVTNYHNFNFIKNNFDFFPLASISTIVF